VSMFPVSGQRYPKTGQTVVVHYTGIQSTLQVYFDVAITSGSGNSGSRACA